MPAARRDSARRLRPAGSERGATRVVVISLLATATAVGGATTFFVAHPEGQRLFRSFLEFAAGRPGAKEPPAASAPVAVAPAPAPPVPKPADEKPPQAPLSVPLEKPAAPESPARREAFELLAKAARALAANDLDAAETAARAALARDPSVSEEANSLLGGIAACRAQAAEAKRRASHDAALESAREFLAKGEFDRAREWAEKALSIVPQSPAALATLNDIARAKESRDAELVARRSRADSLAREGVQALAAGDHEKALELAREALELDPANAAAILLRSQAEREKKRAEEAAAAAGPSHLEIEPPPARRPPEAEEGPSARGPITVEVPPPPARPPGAPGAEAAPARSGPIVLEDLAEPAPRAPPKGPVTIDVSPPAGAAGQPPEQAQKAEPVHVDAGAEERTREPATVEVARGEFPEGDIPLEVQAAVVVLAQLDRAMEREDPAAFERLLSESYSGLGASGARSTRAEELENVRGFFEVASGIRVERTTYEKDIRADPLRAEVRSYFRVSYSLGQTRLSRAYRALYRLARERGQWRIAGVTIEEEGP